MMLLRTLAVPVLVLGLAVAGCGKKTPEGTTPPGETGAGGVAAGDGDSGSAGGGESGEGGEAAASGGEDPSQKVCDAEVSDTPKALFGDNVILRLPKGMDLVEENPFFARIVTRDTVSTCDGVINFSALGYFQADTSKPIKTIRDEVIGQRGLGDASVTWSDETEKGRDYAGAYSVPEDAQGNPPIKGWLVLKEKGGFLFWYLIETHPNAWNALHKTFQESGNRLRISANITAAAPAPEPTTKKKN